MLCAQEDTRPKEDIAAAESRADTERSSARQLATEASADYRAKDFQRAYDKFNRAFRLVGVPALGVWSARSLRQMNRLVEASERYREVVKRGTDPDAPPSYEKALADAEKELNALLSVIPNLVLRLRNADPEEVDVWLDEKLIAPALVGAKQRVDPGSRSITATRGSETIEKTVSLEKGQTLDVILEFKSQSSADSAATTDHNRASSANSSSTTRTLGIVSMSAGGAFLAAGVVATFVALDQQATLNEGCPGGACPPEFHDDVSSFNTMKGLSAAALIGGTVLAGVGVSLYVLAPTADRPSEVALHIGYSRLSLRGCF